MPSVSQKWPGTRLWWIVLALGLAIMVGTAGTLWHLRRIAIEDHARELGLLSRAFADSLSRGLRGVDEGLHAVRLELREHRLALRGEDAARALQTRAELMPLVQTIWLVAEDGRVVLASDATPTPSLGSFHPVLAGIPEATTAISRPFTDGSGSETRVALAIRAPADPGLGVRWVLAALPAEDLRGSFSAAAPAADARLAVFRDDGVRLAGSLVAAPTLDESSLSYRLAARAGVERLRFSDGRERLVSTQSLPTYGLKLVATRDLDAVLAPWREVAFLAGTAVVLLLVVMAMSVHVVLRSDRRRAEAQEALQVELARAGKLQSLGTLAGGVAHDFNNILGAIIGFGEMAQDAAPSGTAQARQLDKLLQAALRGKALVERILTFSRGGARASTVFELVPVVDEVLTLLSASLAPGIVLERSIQAEDAKVRGDPTRAFEAVMNLCTNAMQAMPAGGLVSVRLERVYVESRRVLSHSQLPSCSYVALTVADQGEGITPEVMERLFEPFFTTRKSQSGTGLGLAVVHGVVAEFGGAIDVQSVPGRGARVVLYLPDSADPAPSYALPIPTVTRVGAGQSLLLVDDDPLLLAMMAEMLKGMGFDPVCFGDPGAALDAVRKEPRRYAALVTDEVMPELSGTELVERLRAERPDLPVVLMSGYGGALLAARAAAAGVNRVVAKPVRRAELAHALAELLG